MKNENAEIILQTPLWSGNKAENYSKTLGGPIIAVLGKILEENQGGLTVKVDMLRSEKQVDKNPNVAQLFIPYYKIDHILVPK